MTPGELHACPQSSIFSSSASATGRAVAGTIGGGWLLNANGRRGAAIAVLSILAVPGVLYGLFVLLVIIAQPRWN